MLSSPLSAEKKPTATPQQALPPGTPVKDAPSSPAVVQSPTSPPGVQPAKPSTPLPSPTSLPEPPTAKSPAAPSPEVGRYPAVQCNCSASKDDGKWTGKDWAALLGGLGGLFGSAVAAIAIVSNGRTSRGTTIQKANEAELESLQSKLDNFYGPYLQLSSTNRLIATDLKQHRAGGADMRVLLMLLDPKWKDGFSPGEVALIEEILAIDAKLLELIQEKSGLVSATVQPYLSRAAGHFRIMKLASEGKLDNDTDRYAHYVYPRQLAEVIDLEIARIHGRIDLIGSQPMTLHPPAANLPIPDRLKLTDWPASPGNLQRLG